MKKTLVFVIIIFSGIFGCCGDNFPKWTVSDISLTIRNMNGAEAQNGVIFGDSINLLIEFIPQFTSYNSTFKSPFINSAFALSCPFNGEEGMSDSIKSLVITSDTTFNNFNPNESLNEIVTVGNGITIEEWISYSKEWAFESFNFANFTITEKPISIREHKFKIQIELESGAKISEETDEIIWSD